MANLNVLDECLFERVSFFRLVDRQPIIPPFLVAVCFDNKPTGAIHPFTCRAHIVGEEKIIVRVGDDGRYIYPQTVFLILVLIPDDMVYHRFLHLESVKRRCCFV